MVHPNPDHNRKPPTHFVAMSSPMLPFSVSGTQLSFQASLLTVDNSSVVAPVCDRLSLKSVLGRVVISGEIWMSTRILSLGKGNMVRANRVLYTTTLLAR